jgi:hypothetical protein
MAASHRVLAEGEEQGDEQMIPSKMTRLGAVGAVVAGTAWAFSGVVALVFADRYGTTDPTGTLYFYLFEGAHVVADVGILLALLGFRARQVPGYGPLGTAGFVLAFVGTTLVWFCGMSWLIFLDASNALVVAVVWDIALLCSFVGLPLLGIATFRARTFPRWAGMLLVAYIPLLSVAVFFNGQGGIMLLFLTLVGLLWLALGYALWACRDEPAEQPSPVSPAARETAKL